MDRRSPDALAFARKKIVTAYRIPAMECRFARLPQHDSGGRDKLTQRLPKVARASVRPRMKSRKERRIDSAIGTGESNATALRVTPRQPLIVPSTPVTIPRRLYPLHVVFAHARITVWAVISVLIVSAMLRNCIE